MERLLSGSEDIELMVDFFVRDRFMGLTDDKTLEEFFISYFKDKILYSAFHTEKLYLSDEEKTLEYAGRNTVEPVAEYFLIIAGSDSKAKKKDYAERGAVFSIVHPVISTMDKNVKYFMTCASTLYGFVSNLSNNTDAEEFYGFLSDQTEGMIEGLEAVLEGIGKDGSLSMRRFYDDIVGRYASSTDPSERDGIARTLAGISYRIGIEPDEVPLDKEHYHHIFEVPVQKGFKDGHDPTYDDVFEELMQKSSEATEERFKKGYDLLRGDDSGLDD